MLENNSICLINIKTVDWNIVFKFNSQLLRSFKTTNFEICPTEI